MSESAIVKAIAAIGGSAISFFFGEWSQLFTFFFFAMTLDYISGISASKMTGVKLDSKRGFRGITKKFFMVALIALGHHADLTIGTAFVMSGFTCYFLVNELISIKENYEKINISIPALYLKVVDYFRKKNTDIEIKDPDNSQKEKDESLS